MLFPGFSSQNSRWDAVVSPGSYFISLHPFSAFGDYLLIPASCFFSRSVSIKLEIPAEDAIHSIPGRQPATLSFHCFDAIKSL